MSILSILTSSGKDKLTSKTQRLSWKKSIGVCILPVPPPPISQLARPYTPILDSRGLLVYFSIEILQDSSSLRLRNVLPKAPLLYFTRELTLSTFLISILTACSDYLTLKGIEIKIDEHT